MALADGSRKPDKTCVRTGSWAASTAILALFQRPRQGTLSFGGKPRLVFADEIGADCEQDEDADPDHDHDRPGDVLDLVSQEIGRKAEHGRPGKGADRIGEHKLQP